MSLILKANVLVCWPITIIIYIIQTIRTGRNAPSYSLQQYWQIFRGEDIPSSVIIITTYMVFKTIKNHIEQTAQRRKNNIFSAILFVCGTLKSVLC